MKYAIQASVCNHMGKVRTNNEDNYYLNGLYLPLEKMDKDGCHIAVSKELLQLYAVCDGMGGEEAGEYASYTAVSELASLHDKLQIAEPLRPFINDAITNMNAKICTLRGGKGAGSTIVLLCIHEGQATIAYLGDSRAYLLRKKQLYRLTEDHTQTQRLVNLGVLDEKGAQVHPAQHVLTRYLGLSMGDFQLIPAYGRTQKIKKKDIYLLCSDGLTNMLDEDAIVEILKNEKDEAASWLVKKALDAGGKDNVTAMVVEVK